MKAKMYTLVAYSKNTATKHKYGKSVAELEI